jgi:hypothetical protein
LNGQQRKVGRRGEDKTGGGGGAVTSGDNALVPLRGLPRRAAPRE